MTQMTIIKVLKKVDFILTCGFREVKDRLIRHYNVSVCAWVNVIGEKKTFVSFNLVFFLKHLLYCPHTAPCSCPPPPPRAGPLFNGPRQTWTGSKLQNQRVVKDLRVLYFCKLEEHFSLYWDCIKHLSFPVLFNLCVIVRGTSSPLFFIFALF